MKTLQNITIAAALLFTAAVGAQDKKVDKAIMDESCECIKKIDRGIAKDKKNEEIKTCISASIMADQMKSVVSQMKATTDSLLQAKVDTASAPGKSYTIYADKDYEAIQKQLLADCPALKKLLMSNDDKFENSLSDKKKAMAFYNEGDKYFAAEKYDLAVVEYNKAVKADPKFAFRFVPERWAELKPCTLSGEWKRGLGRFRRFNGRHRSWNRSLGCATKAR